MKTKFAIFYETSIVVCISILLASASPAFGQSNAEQGGTSVQKSEKGKKAQKSSGRQIGDGGLDIGKGAAKGTLDLGQGVTGGAVSLVTGHPVDATASVGKGAAGFGKNVGVGAGKGTYKIGKGVGGLFHHHKKSQ